MTLRRAVVRSAVGAAVGVGALAAVLLLLTIAQAGRILPGTQVLGVDVGGQDRWEAHRTLAPVLERAARRPLAVSAPGSRLSVRRMEAGIRFDVAATVEDALAHGRRGPRAALARLSTPLFGASIPPRSDVDMVTLGRWVETAAGRSEREAHAGDLAIDAAARTVRIEGPRGAVSVDRDASVARMVAALRDPDVARTALVTSVTLPPADRGPIEALGRTVAQSLRTGLTLDHEGRSLRISPEHVGALVTVVAVPEVGAADGDLAPAVHVPVGRLERVLGAAGRATFDRTPEPARVVITDASMVLDGRGSTGFRPVPVDAVVVPSVSRTVFVPRRAAAQLATMLTDGVVHATADLLVVEPDLTTPAAEEQRPTHVIGTFTTRFAAGGARTVNIARLAAIIDGSLVAPGAEFSVNRTSGPRSCAAGFLEAGTIVRGELVDTCGGGVSQLGTTLLNAAFFAGLPLTQWQPHSFYISRYPAGREATLSYPQLDVRFRNDTDGWILLRASTTPTSVTVTLLGRPRWTEVRADHGAWSPPTPFAEVIRVAPDLAPGARRVVQAGGDGFSLTVSRTRVPPDGVPAPEVERWRTVYRPQQRIVEVSPADAPADAAPPAADGGASAD